MLAEMRRVQILERLDQNGEVATDELATILGVSVETVRRDLHVLEDRKQLERVHGGAVSTNLLGEAPHQTRRSHAFDQKKAIAKTVANALHPTATVFLDLGTTVEEVASAIGPDFEGTILTTSLRIGQILAANENATIVIAGGRLRHNELSLSGSATTRFLASYYPDIAVISTGAVDPRVGITDFDDEERTVKQLMLDQSRTSFVVADSTKFNRIAPYKVCDISKASQIVTTREIGVATEKEIEENGGTLLFAD